VGVVEHKDRSRTGYFAGSDGAYSWHGDCAVPSDNDGYGVAKAANKRGRSEISDRSDADIRDPLE